MEDFQKVISNTLNPDKQQREQSEFYLQSCLKQTPQELSSLFLSLMESEDPLLSTQSLVLYRTLFITSQDFLSITSNPGIKLQLLSLIHPSRPLSYLKKLASILIPISITQHFESEILSGLTCTWLTSTSSSLQQFALHFLEISSENPTFLNIISNNALNVLDLMWNVLNTPDELVKIAACKAVCVILSRMDETTKHVIMFNRVLEVVQGSKVVELGPVLNEMLGLINTYPYVCYERLVELTEFLAALVKGTNLELKKQSARLLTEIVIIGDESIFTVKILQELMTVAFTLLSEIDHPVDLQAWVQNESYGNETGPMENGKELLCCLSEISEEKVYSFYILMLEAHLNSQYWLHQHTGILSLGLVSEGFYQKFSSNIDHFVSILCKFTMNENPRLRYAALSSLGLFCTSLSQEIIDNYSASILNCLISNLGLNNPSRVIITALRSVINFCNEVETNEEIKLFERFLPSLIRKYEEIFTNSNTSGKVLTEMISSLTAIIDAVDDFSAYVQIFLPKLESIFFIQGLDDGLKNTALKCVGCIAKSKTNTDNSKILEKMIELKGSVDKDNALYVNLMEAIVKCIVKLKFLPEFFDGLMQEILANANSLVDYFIVDKSLTPIYDHEGIELTVGGCKQKILLDTVVIDNKISACQLLRLLIEGLGELFLPWSNSTFESLVPLTVLLFDSLIKKEASKTLISLLKASPLPVSDSYSFKILSKYIQALQTCDHSNLETINFLLKNIKNISKVIGGLTILGLSGATYLSQILKTTILNILTTTPNSIAQESLDSDPINEKVIKKSLKLSSTLLKSFKIEFKPYITSNFQGLFESILYSSENILASFLYLLCDYIEIMNEVLPTPNIDLVSHLCKFVYYDNEDIRQSSISALGLIAWYSHPNDFQQYLDCTIDACSFLIKLPNAFADYLDSTECAINTLGKIVIKYRQDLLPIWLQHLPLNSDSRPAKEVNGLFLANYTSFKGINGAYQVYSRLVSN